MEGTMISDCIHPTDEKVIIGQVGDSTLWPSFDVFLKSRMWVGEWAEACEFWFNGYLNFLQQNKDFEGFCLSKWNAWLNNQEMLPSYHCMGHEEGSEHWQALYLSSLGDDVPSDSFPVSPL